MKKYALAALLLAFIIPNLANAETVNVSLEGQTYPITYSGNGVTVLGAQTDTDFVSLILEVSVSGNQGVLDIDVDRSFLDSRFENADVPFIILADGDEPLFSETSTTQTTRTLSITLAGGTEEVEIIGTEFGSESAPVEEPEEKEIPASFVDPSKDPASYIDRYFAEPSYKAWFEENYPDYTIYEAVDMTAEEYAALVKQREQEKPVVEQPKEEKPVVEQPKEEKPKDAECGEGTILKDGVCVLDERCGPGTILVDGECIAQEKETRGFGYETLYAAIAAFIIAGAVGVILALMSRASKQKKSNS